MSIEKSYDSFLDMGQDIGSFNGPNISLKLLALPFHCNNLFIFLEKTLTTDKCIIVTNVVNCVLHPIQTYFLIHVVIDLKLHDFPDYLRKFSSF